MLLMHYLLLIPYCLSLFNDIFSSLFDEMHIQRKAVELKQGWSPACEEQLREQGVFSWGEGDWG